MSAGPAAQQRAGLRPARQQRRGQRGPLPRRPIINAYIDAFRRAVRRAVNRPDPFADIDALAVAFADADPVTFGYADAARHGRADAYAYRDTFGHARDQRGSLVYDPECSYCNSTAD